MSDANNGSGKHDSAVRPPPADFYVRQALREDEVSAGEKVTTTVAANEMGMMRNPLVPAGMLVTAVVLGRGLYHFLQGNAKLSQRYMRYRVAAQFVTVCALGFGAVYFGDVKTDEFFSRDRPQPAGYSHSNTHANHHEKHKDNHHAQATHDNHQAHTTHEKHPENHRNH